MNSKFFPSLYDLFMAPVEPGRLGRWRESIVAGARGQVLEIGAGTRLNFAHYDPSVWVVATDPDVGVLARARPRAAAAAAEIALVAADAEALPFRPSAFDSGVVGLAMCTIPHPDKALSELRRTRPGAGLRLLEHVRLQSPVLGRMQDWLTPAWRRVAGGCRLSRRTAETVSASRFTLESVTPRLGGHVEEMLARTTGAP